jgi:hypothetical protein
MAIDWAILYDDRPPDGEHQVFKGVGFVAVSKLGIETLDPGAEIFDAPRDGARRLLKITATDESKIPKAQVLACAGDYLKVRVGDVVGWTNGFCSNQRTTCS